MKTLKFLPLLFFSFVLCLFCSYEASAQVEFELKPSQSMAITGKGPGQDAANNPYDGQDCLVLIENIGVVDFEVRTQQKGQKNLSIISLAKGTTKTISLPKGYELYLDTTSEGIARARLAFKPKKN